MGAPTAFARVTQTLPNAKPQLRLWMDTVRLVALSQQPDGSGRTRMRAAAEAMFDAAINDKNTAAMALIGDRLDGKVQVQPGEDGSTQLSFVVRLPQQLSPEEWAQSFNGRAAPIAEHQTVIAGPIGGSMNDATNVWPEHVTGVTDIPEPAGVTELGHVDGHSAQSVADPEPAAVGYADTAPPRADAEPLLPGTQPVVSDRTDG